MKIPSIALVSVLAWLVLAGPALAGTVTADSSCSVGSKDELLYCTVHVELAAAAGEENVVRVAAARPAAAIVEDTGAPLTAGAGCVQDGPHRVRCPATPEREPDVVDVAGRLAAGDGDDVLRVPADGSWFELDGGPGDDRLHGGIVTYASRTRPVHVNLRERTGGSRGERDVLVEVDGVRGGSGDDTILTDRGGKQRCFDEDYGAGNLVWAGPGDDRVIGVGGTDCIIGGAGKDELAGAGGTDYLDGATGADRLDGGAGEGSLYGRDGADRISGVGGFMQGGEGADVIADGPGSASIWGGPGPDRIDGGAGNDTVTAEGGNDRIVGGPGSDSLSGDAGRDLLLARDGTRDDLYGGSGRDTAVADARDRLRRVELSAQSPRRMPVSTARISSRAAAGSSARAT